MYTVGFIFKVYTHAYIHRHALATGSATSVTFMADTVVQVIITSLQILVVALSLGPLLSLLPYSISLSQKAAQRITLIQK